MATVGEEENLYEILGVPSTANQADIQSAFKKKARELHPDVNKAPDAEENFKRLNAAYAILKDEGKRARYDAFGIRGSSKKRPDPRAQPPPRPKRTGPRPSPKPDNGVRFEDINVDTEDFKNPFDFFLRREQARRKKREEPEVQLSIPIQHSYTGTNLSVSVDLPGPNGLETRKLKIKIPKGAKAGDRLKLKDPQIVVVLGFDQDSRFTIEGRDISMELSITPWEAALGETIDFDAPGGTLKLKIPEGTSTGRRLRLRGQGIPLKPDKEGDPGDLYVTLRVVVSPTTTDAERELWIKLKNTSAFNPR